jgi:hypothetical protein
MSFSFGRGSEVFVHRRWFFSDWCSLGSRCRMSRAAHIQVAMSWMHRSTIFFSNIRRDCNLRIGELKQPRNCLSVIDLLLLSEALALSPKRVFFLAHGHIEEGLEHSTVSIFLFFFQSQSAHLDSLYLPFLLLCVLSIHLFGKGFVKYTRLGDHVRGLQCDVYIVLYASMKHQPASLAQR